MARAVSIRRRHRALGARGARERCGRAQNRDAAVAAVTAATGAFADVPIIAE